MNHKMLIIITLILSFLGFLDASYLTIVHYKNVVPPCSLAHGCETVLFSKYATIGPIPIALIGVGFYLTLLILLGLFLQAKKKMYLNFAFIISAISIVVSIILIYLQAMVLHAFCQYCLASEAINFLIFIALAWIFLRTKQTLA